MNPPTPPKRHSFRPLLFSPAQGEAALPNALPPPPPARAPKALPRVAPPPPRVPSAPAARPTVELAAPPARRGSGESHVRLRAMPLGDITWLDANLLLDELAEEQLNVGVSLAALERAIEQSPRDPSARAALSVLEARVRDLGRVRDALAGLHAEAADARVHRVFLPDGPLADYLRGVYAWMHAVVRALEHLAVGLRTLQPDWAQLRYRIEEANLFHFDELTDAIQADLVALALVCPGGSAGLEGAVDALLAAARELEARLDERFG